MVPEISGILVAETLRYVRDKMGQNGVIGISRGTVFDGPIYEGKWYPIKQFIELLHRLEVLRSWEDDVTGTAAVHSVVKSQTLRGVFLRASAKKLLSNQRTNQRIRGGVFETTEEPAGTFTFTLSGWSEDPIFCTFMFGRIKGVLQLMGCEKELEHVMCVKDGLPQCQYRIEIPFASAAPPDSPTAFPPAFPGR